MKIRTRATSAFGALAALAIIVPISATSSATDWRRTTEAHGTLAGRDVSLSVEHIGTNFEVDVLLLDPRVNDYDDLTVDVHAPGRPDEHLEAQLAKRFNHEIYGMRTSTTYVDVGMDERRAVSVDLTWTKGGMLVGRTTVTADAI
ncbi:hypothetical protein LVJ94_49085 [Pendulispora rubella]|uniref:Uncharacterized protein n=1 Tax=Pendulispora rubella TaxID=2741070 RepID=A0ABZ2L1M6_9BACT